MKKGKTFSKKSTPFSDSEFNVDYDFIIKCNLHFSVRECGAPKKNIIKILRKFSM